MQEIAISPELFVGAISLEHNDDGIRPWRIPHEKKELYFPALQDRASCSAGVRLQLQTNSNKLILHVINHNEEGSTHCDCTVDNELVQSAELAAGKQVLEFNSLPGSDSAVDIWLPHNAPVTVCKIEIDDGSSCVAREDKRLRWLHYGSSISQCGSAHSPARTWPATAARKCDLNLRCLGYGGNCHLETMLARMIRDQEADFMTFKIGINVQGASSLNQRTWQEAVIGLIETVREKHPTTPIGVITSIISPPREDGQNQVEMSLEDYRIGVREAVARIKKYSDAPLELFEGLDVFGSDLLEYLPDDLHPNGDGYEILGNNIAEKILTPLLSKYF